MGISVILILDIFFDLRKLQPQKCQFIMHHLPLWPSSVSLPPPSKTPLPPGEWLLRPWVQLSQTVIENNNCMRIRFQASEIHVRWGNVISPEHRPNLILLSLLVCTPTCVNCVSLKVCSFCVESKFNSEVAFKRWKSRKMLQKKKKNF